MKTLVRSTISTFLATLGIGLAAAPATAEPFSVLYLGFSITNDAPYTLNGLPLPPSFVCIQQCSSAKSAAGGIRIGYWLEPLPWLGFAGDVSAYVTGWGIESPYEVTLYPISPLVLVRARLVEREGFPNGRVQPYVAVGPGFFISAGKVTTGYTFLGTSQSASGIGFDVGIDARAGIELLAADWFGVNLEYRYAFVTSSFKIDGQTVKSDFSTSQFLVGLSVHY